MKTGKFIIKLSFLVASVLLLGLMSCQKMGKPALGKYPVDSNPPGGPLKFYVAFDGTGSNGLLNAVDSIKAGFPNSNTGSSADGITGKCYQGSATAFVTYPSPNDFATSSTSFTIAFWMKKTPQTAGSGTNFAFSLNAKGYSWTNTKLFLEFEDWSTLTTGNCKFYLMDQWIEYTNANGMPNVTNGQWHQLTFTYDGPSSTLKAYIDGSIFHTDVVNGLGPVTFGDFTDFTIGGPSQYTHDQNSWMGFWENGYIDQFRMYNTVLSSSDVTALYNSKL
jgi:hypothetical protein